MFASGRLSATRKDRARTLFPFPRLIVVNMGDCAAMKVPSPFLSAAAAMLSGQGAGARLLILTYHRVLAEADPLMPGEVDAVRFEMQLEVLQSSFNILRLDQACDLMRAGQ